MIIVSDLARQEGHWISYAGLHPGVLIGKSDLEQNINPYCRDYGHKSNMRWDLPSIALLSCFGGVVLPRICGGKVAFYCTFELFRVVLRLRICGGKVVLRDHWQSPHDEGGPGGVGHLDHESQTLNVMFDESKDISMVSYARWRALLRKPQPGSPLANLSSSTPPAARQKSRFDQDMMLVTCNHSR
jgi:hypothetical protein